MDELFENSGDTRDFCYGRIEKDAVYDYRIYIDFNNSILLSVKRISGNHDVKTMTFKTFDEFKESKIGNEIFEFRKHIPDYIKHKLVENYLEVNIENAYYYLNTQLLNSSAKSAHVKK
jgi:hypothetical protein